MIKILIYIVKYFQRWKIAVLAAVSYECSAPVHLRTSSAQQQPLRNTFLCENSKLKESSGHAPGQINTCPAR